MDTLYCILALISIVFLGIIYINRWNTKKRTANIPGLSASDPVQGNLLDIQASGSFHEFLNSLHQKYGEIASFWWADLLCVSIASPTLFKEHARIFDRPKKLYTLFEPLFGPESITYGNGEDGKRRICAFANCFSYEAIQNYYPILHQLSKNQCAEFDKCQSDEHIPLQETMCAFSCQAIFDAALNKCFENKADVLKFKKNYDTVWWYMEDTLKGNKHDAETTQQFDKCNDEIQSMFQTIGERITSCPLDLSDLDEHKLIDTMIKLSMSTEQTKNDLITLVIAGFHTSSLILTWAIYYIASYPYVQEKIYKELVDILGEEEVTRDISGKLVYLRQVIDESLRYSNLAPYAARVNDTEMKLGGFKIPPGTPVVQAMGVVHASKKWWVEPEKFNPDRFNPENRCKLGPHVFEPFGFAGGRKCIGYQFALHETTILLSHIFRKYKVHLVPGQEVIMLQGLITKPKDEIWITLEKRIRI